MKLMDELAGLVTELTGAKIEYAVCGGIAMSLHGFTRFTKDIDVLVHPDDLDRILKAVKNRGFEFGVKRMTLRGGTPEEMQIQRVTKVVDTDYLVLDLVLVADTLIEVWKTRELFAWNGQQVCVISKTGLTAMKQLAGRPQDLVDIQRLEYEDE